MNFFNHGCQERVNMRLIVKTVVKKLIEKEQQNNDYYNKPPPVLKITVYWLTILSWKFGKRSDGQFVQCGIR